MLDKPECPFSTNDVLREQLTEDWILRDKIQSECNVVEKETEYYRIQQVTDVTIPGSNDHLIFQRIIGYPSVDGNEKWIAKDECYICERW